MAGRGEDARHPARGSPGEIISPGQGSRKPKTMTGKIKLGVSACLLGEAVRYDGGHKLDRFIRDTLGQFVEYVPVCPEVECASARAQRGPQAGRTGGEPPAENPKDRAGCHRFNDRLGRDKTGPIGTGRALRISLQKQVAIQRHGPGCGCITIPVYRITMEWGYGPGCSWTVFPLLPVEEDGRLHDPVLREMFIERIFVFKRWREQVAGQSKWGALIEFHARHKMLVMSHSPGIYRQLGRLTANTRSLELAAVKSEYLNHLTKALSLKTTIKKNVNVLKHLIGYFKKNLSASEKQEFQMLLDQYKQSLIPPHRARDHDKSLRSKI